MCCAARRRAGWSRRRSAACPSNSARSSRCVTSPAARPTRRAISSSCRTPSPASACIRRGAGCEPPSSVTSMADSPDHLSCQELVELVTGYLEGALLPDETALVEQHLNFCEGCVWYLEQMRATIRSAGRLAEQDIDADHRDRLLAAFHGWRS